MLRHVYQRTYRRKYPIGYNIPNFSLTLRYQTHISTIPKLEISSPISNFRSSIWDYNPIGNIFCQFSFLIYRDIQISYNYQFQAAFFLFLLLLILPPMSLIAAQRSEVRMSQRRLDYYQTRCSRFCDSALSDSEIPHLQLGIVSPTRDLISPRSGNQRFLTGLLVYLKSSVKNCPPANKKTYTILFLNTQYKVSEGLG